MTDENRAASTFRVADGTAVWFSDALAAWVPLAFDQLLATAGRYQAIVTYDELSEGVQQASGIRTSVPPANWIGKLLEAVAVLAKAQGEPPLTSLCVRADGTVGSSYARMPNSLDDEPGGNVQRYAARHRLLCYQKYASDLPPSDGPVAPATVKTRTASPRTARAAKAVVPERVRPPTCPVHFTELPMSGRCGECD